MKVPCIIQTEDEVVTPDSGMFEPRLREYNPREKERPASKPSPKSSAGRAPGWQGRFIGKSHRVQTKFSSDLEDQSEDRGVKMQMVVCVHMVERKSRVTECLKLSADFRF